MAKWKCPVFGCKTWAFAPDTRPVHTPSVYLKGDPRCHDHPTNLFPGGVEMDWVAELVAPNPVLVARHPGYTLSRELLTSYSINEQPGIRKELSALMGISDKGHKKHGSNFSSPQTLKQIIDNLFATVQGTTRDDAAQAIIGAHGYDPRTMLMA